jgi:branched-chain amino acid transport system ATP-binding protein
LRDRGVSILMTEQNARSALEISDFGIALELGQTRLVDKAERVLGDPRIGQFCVGGAMTESVAEQARCGRLGRYRGPNSIKHRPGI